MEKRLAELFAKHVARINTDEESREFWKMVKEGSYDALLAELIDNHQNSFEGGENPLSAEAERRILNVVFASGNKPASMEVPAVRLKRPWLGWAAAAVATIIVSAGIWFYQASQKDKTNQIALVNDVAPGKVGATLTLASGKKIRLSDVVNGEIAREAGISVSKTTDGQLVYEIRETSDDPNKINTLSTAKGETYMLTLPDKSKVWLNAASSLTYSANLVKNGQRRVALSGEGYFEVAKDKAHPFIVQTDKQEVEVLGTHFNINCYSDESVITTTLLEGSVKVISGNNKQIIKPGEQTLNNGNTIKITQANIENITDWKDGDFYFERVDFRSAMRKIARWYDVEVIYDKSVPADIRSGGWISRDNKLSAVLKSIEKSGQVHFKINGKIIYVTK